MTSPLITFASLLYKTNRFHGAVRLFSNRSQKMSKCGKNIYLFYSVTHSAVPRVPLFCSYHILTSSVIYLNRRIATWNLVVRLDYTTLYYYYYYNNYYYYILYYYYQHQVNLNKVYFRPQIAGASRGGRRWGLQQSVINKCTNENKYYWQNQPLQWQVNSAVKLGGT